MNKKYADVQYVDFYKYNRIIAISDIHGDPESFAGVLNKVHFADNDALVIVGDILGRGDRQLRLLQMVVDYAKKGNLYMVRGNHDGILNEWYDGDISDEEMHGYLNSGKSSIVTEMAEALKLTYETLEETRILKTEIKKTFADEIVFLEKLPDIIDSNAAIFVHAGIRPGSLYEQDYIYCLTAKAFAEQEYCFIKPVITGHWPASNYSEQVINVNIYFNRKTNVIGIDGGNSMKSWMQINYLILDRSGAEIESGYYDRLPKVRALEAQAESTEPVTLIFPKTRIEIKKTMDTESICYVPYLNREITVENQYIYKYKGDTYCFDFTTYHLPVAAGEILTYCKAEKDCILVKRNGIVGKYTGKYEYID